jgi:CHAT domain-containing protein
MNICFHKFIYLLLVVFIGRVPIIRAQSSEPTLIPGQTVDREISGAESHRYRVKLTRGQFVQFKVDQDTVDVALKLIDSDGKTLAMMDSWDHQKGPETLSYIAQKHGVVVLEIKSSSEEVDKGHYSVFLAGPRRTTGVDGLVTKIDKLYVEGLRSDGAAGKAAIIKRMHHLVQQAVRIKNEDLIQFAVRRQLDLYESALSSDPPFLEAMAAFSQKNTKSFEIASKKFKQAAADHQAAGKPYYAALCLAFAALSESRLGNNAIGAQYYLESLPIFRRYRDDNWLGIITRELGSYYDLTGQKVKALEYYSEALQVLKKAKDRQSEGLTLENIGMVLDSFGEKQKALTYHRRALTIFELIGDKQMQGHVLTAIGRIYASLGEYEDALKNYGRSLPLSRSEADKVGEAATLLHIGAVHFLRGETNEARSIFDQAIALQREIGDVSLEAEALGYLGWICQRGGNTHEALASFMLAQSLYKRMGDKEGEAKILRDLGALYLMQNDPQRALTYLEQALPIERAIGYRTGEAATLSYLMVAWKKLGNPRYASFFGKQSVNDHQRLRTNIADMEKSIQQKYLGMVQGPYRYLAEILIADGRISEAEQVLNMLKEEESFSYLRRDDKVARGLSRNVALNETEKAALTRYNDLADRITAIGKQFGELDLLRKQYEEGRFPQQARLEELRKALADAATVFQKFLDELKVTFGQKDERVVQVDSSLQNTLKRLDAKRTAAVSTIVGEDRLNIIVTTANTQRAHTIGEPAEEINQLVAEFRRALTDPRVDPRPAGQKLYDILLKPIEGDLKGIDADTILWSLDGTLRYIPIAAVWDKDKGYLAERFSSVVLTLASRDTLGLPISDKAAWNALGVGVSKPTEGFTALTAVPDELDCIITDRQNKTVAAKPKCTTGVVHGRKLLDEKFTATSFENALGRYPIVHIASHFSLNPGNDKDSFLLLGGGDQRKFTVENLRNVSLADVELMVLSACNTATPGGEKANGVEIEGFGAVAQKQGAKAVMATLWPVADESTRDLMVRFYQLYDKAGLTKAEAVRQAQLEMLRSKVSPTAACSPIRAEVVGTGKKAEYQCDPSAPYAHPYYWAPFVLFGNWR